jgi:hypothetical protein
MQDYSTENWIIVPFRDRNSDYTARRDDSLRTRLNWQLVLELHLSLKLL